MQMHAANLAGAQICHAIVSCEHLSDMSNVDSFATKLPDNGSFVGCGGCSHNGRGDYVCAPREVKPAKWNRTRAVWCATWKEAISWHCAGVLVS